MKWRHVGVVFRKELTDGLRDRRSLFSALVLPLVGPLLVVMMFRFIAQQNSADEPVPLPIVGAEHAPGLVEALRNGDITPEPAPEDPEQAVKTGTAPAVLLITSEYGEHFRSAKSVRVELLVDNSRNETRSKIRRVKRALDRFNSEVATARLITRGIDPQIARPLAVDEVDLATPEQLAGSIFNMVPMFLMMAAFVGGMYVATDSTAGERERGSLEPLLGNPASRTALVMGKWLATSVLSAASLLATLVTLGVALSLAPLQDLGVEIEFGPSLAWRVGLVMLPIAGFAGGVQLVVATFARSFREAQTYLSVLTLAPMIPGMWLVVAPIDAKSWAMWVPVLGQQVAMVDIIRGEQLGIAGYVVPAVIAVIVALASVRVTAWLLGRERIIFGS